jgi:flagellar protein FliS
MDDARNRFLRDRVLTATPAQRVVMLYDRLALDLTRAVDVDTATAGAHIGHAEQIIAELFGSLDVTVGGPADNLAAIYSYLLRECMQLRAGGSSAGLNGLIEIVVKLRAAWVGVTEQLSSVDGTAAGVGGRLLAGAWVG